MPPTYNLKKEDYKKNTLERGSHGGLPLRYACLINPIRYYWLTDSTNNKQQTTNNKSQLKTQESKLKTHIESSAR